MYASLWLNIFVSDFNQLLHVSYFGNIEVINGDNACYWPCILTNNVRPNIEDKDSIHRGHSDMRWYSPAARALNIGSNQVQSGAGYN